MWFPLTLYHIIAALAATGFSRYGLFARRYVPQYQQELEEYLKNEPPHRKDEIEKANLTMLVLSQCRKYSPLSVPPKFELHRKPAVGSVRRMAIPSHGQRYRGRFAAKFVSLTSNTWEM